MNKNLMIEDIINPISWLCIVFASTIMIHYYRNKKNIEFDEKKFCDRYLKSQGLAVIYSLFYLCICDYLSKFNSVTISFYTFCLSFFLLISITMIQNKENGGYIENFEGASGAIMYITASQNPVIFIFFYALVAMWQYLIIKREGEYEYRKNFIIKVLEAIEALITAFLVNNFHLFTNLLSKNAFIIAVFTLIMPLVNDIITEYMVN